MLQIHNLSTKSEEEWVDLESPTEEETNQLGHDYKLPTIYLQDVMQPEHLPKWEYADDEQLYFLIGRYHDEQVPERGETTIRKLTRKIAIFVQPGRIITIHRGQAAFLDELKSKCSVPDGRYPTTFHVLCRIIKETFRSYEPMVLRASEDIDFYEQRIFENRNLPPFIRGLFQVRRRISVIRRILLLSRTLIDALREQPNADQAQIQDARDMYLRVETIIEDLNERATGLISVHLAMSDQRSNEVMRVLTVFSAFFLPVTFIAGIYGMNFVHMPELTTRFGYYACLGLMALVSVTIYAWFKRKGWL